MKFPLPLFAGLLCLAGNLAAQQEANPERTAPYFMVDQKEGVEAFPLLKTEADVNIAGTVADVELTQVYKNSGDTTIEAVYVFPMGTGAAIHGMTMEIGDRTIKAKIQERQKARQTYEDAKDAGKATSLLEQERPNVFTMNVANIMPGDVVNVTVEYTELLVPDEGAYEFVFPTVVGPRFTGESGGDTAESRDEWAATPYQHEGEKPAYAFNIEATLRTGIPITELEVPSHTVNVEKSGAEASVTLAPGERKAGNKDFVLRYSLRGDAIRSGLLLYPGESENHFLLMMEPPATTAPDAIPPREYLFLVDVSGSMNGFPLDTSKHLIKQIVGNLRPTDYFNVLFFAGGSKVLSEKPLPATSGNVDKALEMLDRQRGGGGTRILDALQRASALPKQEGVARTIVAATDGYVSVEKEAFDLIRGDMADANFFAFGIGRSVNRHLIEGMARVGQGKPFVVLDAKEAKRKANDFVEYVRAPVLTDIDVSFEGFDAYDVQPPNLPDLFSQRPLILYGKYREPTGAIQVTGRTGEGSYFREFAVSPDLEDETNTALPYLWARKKLQLLSDYAKVGADNREAITAIGLEYGLMTAHTSFVAVDTKVRDTGETVTVEQPLPLPQGVSDLAVGNHRHVASKRSRVGTGSVQAFGNARGQTQTDATKEIDATGPSAPSEQKKTTNGTDGKAGAPLRIVDGTPPPGLSLKDLEHALRSQLGDALSAKLKAWTVSELVVEVTFKNGTATDAKILSYKGRKMDDTEVTGILKRLSLNERISGPARFTIRME